MARTDNLNNFLTDVAAAIRSKTGTSSVISASTFDTKIRAIETGITLQNYKVATYPVASGQTIKKGDFVYVGDGIMNTNVIPESWTETIRYTRAEAADGTRIDAWYNTNNTTLNNNPGHAVDRDTTSYWNSGPGNSAPYIYITFPKAVKILKMHLYWNGVDVEGITLSGYSSSTGRVTLYTSDAASGNTDITLSNPNHYTEYRITGDLRSSTGDKLYIYDWYCVQWEDTQWVSKADSVLFKGVALQGGSYGSSIQVALPNI